MGASEVRGKVEIRGEEAGVGSGSAGLVCIRGSPRDVRRKGEKRSWQEGEDRREAEGEGGSFQGPASLCPLGLHLPTPQLILHPSRSPGPADSGIPPRSGRREVKRTNSTPVPKARMKEARAAETRSRAGAMATSKGWRKGRVWDSRGRRPRLLPRPWPDSSPGGLGSCARRHPGFRVAARLCLSTRSRAGIWCLPQPATSASQGEMLESK